VLPSGLRSESQQPIEQRFKTLDPERLGNRGRNLGNLLDARFQLLEIHVLALLSQFRLEKFAGVPDRGSVPPITSTGRYADEPRGRLRAVETGDARKKFRQAVEKYISDEMSNLDGFDLLDETNRYEIIFPAGWTRSK